MVANLNLLTLFNHLSNKDCPKIPKKWTKRSVPTVQIFGLLGVSLLSKLALFLHFGLFYIFLRRKSLILSKTSSFGWPKLLFSPTPIKAIFGVTNSKNLAMLEVLEP